MRPSITHTHTPTLNGNRENQTDCRIFYLSICRHSSFLSTILSNCCVCFRNSQNPNQPFNRLSVPHVYVGVSSLRLLRSIPYRGNNFVIVAVHALSYHMYVAESYAVSSPLSQSSSVTRINFKLSNERQHGFGQSYR